MFFRTIVGRLFEAFRASGPLWTASLLLDRAGVPATRFWPETRVPAEILERQIASILSGLGMPDEHTAITTQYLMYADLRAVDSHGCSMIHNYYRKAARGSLTMNAKIEVLRDAPATAVIDGGGGLGFAPADMAMKLAIEKCKKFGLGGVTVRNSGHFGAAGAYALLAARSGFIGIATTNTSRPAVVPTFGAQSLLGTNPIAFAAPAQRNAPFLLDMATSTVPLGKIMMAKYRGESIPQGWAVDQNGQPSTDAGRALDDRMLTPLGGTRIQSSHKGYGLAAMVEILSSVLSGLRPSHSDLQKESRVGHFFLAIDPEQFHEPQEFQADLDTLMDSLRNCKALKPDQPVLVPGDPESAALAERSKSGIPIPRSVMEELREVSNAAAEPFLLDD